MPVQRTLAVLFQGAAAVPSGMSKSRQQNNLEVGHYLDLGVRMFVFLALFTFAGYGLDQWLDSYPLWLVVGAILGAGAGMTHVVVSVLKESGGPLDRSERSDRGDPDDETP